MSNLNARLLVHVEGVTEETFVNEVIAPHLKMCGYAKIGARLLGNARNRHNRGGNRGWPSVRYDIVKHLKEDSGCLATTMVDFYALPQTGPNAWPGRSEAKNVPFALKAETVERALSIEVSHELGPNFESNRFLPYIVMHEFEALLFSDCSRFAEGIARSELASSFQAIRDSFGTPEEINDSPLTAPSKRVEALVPGYEKPVFGTLAALSIGLDTIRAQCPYFNKWLELLEAWPK